MKGAQDFLALFKNKTIKNKYEKKFHWKEGAASLKRTEYRSSLSKLTRKLRIYFTNKNVRKKLKVLVAFLSNQNMGEQLGLLPCSFFLKVIWSKLWENHLTNKKINMQISFKLFLRGEPKSKHALIQKRSEN